MSNTYYTKWSWDELNQYSQSTLEEISKAYNAVTSNGLCSDFEYVVWNDIVRLVNETMILSGYGWQTSNRYSDETVMSYDTTLLSEEDKVLTAKRFNAVRFQIDRFKEWFWEYDDTVKGYIGRRSFLGIADVGVDEADKVYGTYFLELTTAINDMIDELEKYMMYGVVELDFNTIGALVNGESKLCEAYINLCESTNAILAIDVPIPLSENTHNILLKMLTDLTVIISNALNVHLDGFNQDVILNSNPSNSTIYEENLPLEIDVVLEANPSLDNVYHKNIPLVDNPLPTVSPGVNNIYIKNLPLLDKVSLEANPSINNQYMENLPLKDDVIQTVSPGVNNFYQKDLSLSNTAILIANFNRYMYYLTSMLLLSDAFITVSPGINDFYSENLPLLNNVMLEVNISNNNFYSRDLNFSDEATPVVSPGINKFYSENLPLLDKALMAVNLSLNNTLFENLPLKDNVIPIVSPGVNIFYFTNIPLLENVNISIDSPTDSKYETDIHLATDAEVTAHQAEHLINDYSLNLQNFSYLIIELIRMCIYKIRLNLKNNSIISVILSGAMCHDCSVNLKDESNLTSHLAEHLMRLYEIGIGTNIDLKIDDVIAQNEKYKIQLIDNAEVTVGDAVPVRLDVNINNNINANFNNGEPNSLILINNIQKNIIAIATNGMSQVMNFSKNIILDNYSFLTNCDPEAVKSKQNICIVSSPFLFSHLPYSIGDTTYNILTETKATLSTLNSSSDHVVVCENLSPKLTTNLKVWLMPIQKTNMLKIRQGYTISKVDNKLYIK